MRRRRTKRGVRADAGFTLIEIAVVIVVLSLLIAMIAGIATAMLGQQRREATRQRLAGVETAIALFVSQNKRLPCPADGRISGTASGAGIEARNDTTDVCEVGGAANTQTHGVVPWQALGLAEQDVTDGWGNRLTYRVAPELVLDSAMDFTACDPGGAFDLTGTPLGRCNQVGAGATDCSSANFPSRCTPPSAYTQDKGLRVRNLVSPTPVMNPGQTPVSTGAAYVVISHGENGQGAYSNQGTLQAGTIASGTLESDNNAADVAFVTSTSLTAAAFVDDFPVFIEGAGHFDDWLLRPSILTVATKAQLGPRAH
jgi:prepilin-type N-terminal cleavage/methylation domain-containing protein